MKTGVFNFLEQDRVHSRVVPQPGPPPCRQIAPTHTSTCKP